jgi:uncharacterized protein YwgA
MLGRKEITLIAMAPAKGAVHTPVQMQKLIFLIDRKLSTPLSGPHFDFVAYDYGPFDRLVYDTLEELECDGHVEILKSPNLGWSKYRTTAAGQKLAEELLNALPRSVASAIERLSTFVRSLSFAQLVTAIYRAYPEMKVNSVFRQ